MTVLCSLYHRHGSWNRKRIRKNDPRFDVLLAARRCGRSIRKVSPSLTSLPELDIPLLYLPNLPFPPPSPRRLRGYYSSTSYRLGFCFYVCVCFASLSSGQMIPEQTRLAYTFPQTANILVDTKQNGTWTARGKTFSRDDWSTVRCETKRQSAFE